ncbi:DUF3267 domain-containing protein [Staphylococcus felis]|uniref:DUF3267 domain-containing protein n=1 Tax=Staphylococcus felis TaxID=46127 RepID=A0A2K3Z9K2_9STAP|nr:DUF3267 domain-containing protein [Staphylococcus felis]AVP37383.1 DUF3267 domain-containing protein [Staphylococcus felis]MBH9580169.1 DUF3267 domain-containing protein [Staphylococcus felis]PNZ34550.1 hypothetical protein CD143_08640 [Staphylococcus felis]QQB02671.1 DUF3267 domain-containing protein [Staphylococcus felis]REH76923.1 DUF3267 domain-containing protein [Staphylococcus felis]
MLNCLRSIDIHSRFGLPRIAFISFVTVVITFFISFELFHFSSRVPFTDQHFILFIVLMLFLYPFHKLIHILMVLPYFKYLRITKLIKTKWLPLYNIFLDKPVSKLYFCICLIMPLILITALCVYIARLIPEYGHYFMFLLSLNAGYSVMDLLYLKVIVFSRQGKYVEEHINGFVLLEKNYK